jgi:Flp pilus assembly protein TadG
MTGPINERSIRGRHGSAGQALVVIALALIVLLGMVALIIDGGNAYAQQRSTQNGTDAIAEAGAVVLAERLAGGTPTDADVLAAVNDMATLNGVTLASAEYTDILGAPLGIAVGSTGGAIPTSASGSANDRAFDTFIARVIDFEPSSVRRATAVASYKKTTCDSAEDVCLPITPPIARPRDGTNKPVPVPPGQEWTKDIRPSCRPAKRGRATSVD